MRTIATWRTGSPFGPGRWNTKPSATWLRLPPIEHRRAYIRTEGPFAPPSLPLSATEVSQSRTSIFHHLRKPCVPSWQCPAQASPEVSALSQDPLIGHRLHLGRYADEPLACVLLVCSRCPCGTSLERGARASAGRGFASVAPISGEGRAKAFRSPIDKSPPSVRLEVGRMDRPHLRDASRGFSSQWHSANRSSARRSRAGQR